MLGYFWHQFSSEAPVWVFRSHSWSIRSWLLQKKPQSPSSALQIFELPFFLYLIWIRGGFLWLSLLHLWVRILSWFHVPWQILWDIKKFILRELKEHASPCTLIFRLPIHLHWYWHNTTLLFYLRRWCASTSSSTPHVHTDRDGVVVSWLHLVKLPQCCTQQQNKIQTTC